MSDSPAGPHGEHNCDTPVSLADSMYAAILDVASDAAFALCTGDIVDHSLWNTSVEYNTFESPFFPPSYHVLLPPSPGGP